MLKFIFKLLCIFIPLGATAQEFNYVHYDTKDGLAGSTVYDMCQDSDGFIWFATDNGLSRFDGTHFSNFTVKEGLPDNEVLKIFADSKGRVWIGTFNKQLAYYYKGKIYNRNSDSLLRKIRTSAVMLFFFEDNKKNVYLSDTHEMYMITADNQLIDYFDAIGFYSNSERYLTLHYYSNINKLVIASMDSFYSITNNKLHIDSVSKKKSTLKRTVIRLLPDNSYVWVDLPGNIISPTFSGNAAVYFSTADGAWSTDTVANKLLIHFLPGKKVSRTFEDQEQNIWFATLGQGVFKLPSTETKTFKFSKSDADNNEVYCIEKQDNAVICGLGQGRLARIKNYSPGDISTPALSNNLTATQEVDNRLYCIKTFDDGSLLLGFDSYLIKKKDNNIILKNIPAIKSIAGIDAEHLLLGTSRYTFVLDRNLTVRDTIWHERTTKVYFYNHLYFVGTVEGLYEIGPDKSYKYLASVSNIFGRRITGLCEAAGKLWVATSDQGLASYKDGKLLDIIDDSKGLSSNICLSMIANGHFLWVGTNKGLNKIDLSKPGFPIVKYSASDGLPSDIISAVLVDANVVWVGSPAGLTYFDETNISGNSVCNLKLLDFSVSGKSLEIARHYDLSYNNSSIRVQFVAISYKSSGDITYHYKLIGSTEEDWKSTTQTVLEYQALQPGDYQLELYAVNKFGVTSKHITASVFVKAPFWKTWWFYALVVLFVVLLTGGIGNWRNKRLRMRQEEKNSYQRQFATLEQRALQAQMNPHFIFNCLNSIQQYILTNDKENANRYLTGFASLIRQTLYNSGKKTITVAEEIQYLSKYLEMEQMRFGNNFTYEISVEDESHVKQFEIPALLLQPFVENALRHGIRNKTEGIGKINVFFALTEGVLCCTIRDNGVGRKKAESLKTNQHIEYQSQGIRLTEKRVELLNKINGNSMTIGIVDLTGSQGQSLGTEVIVKIPV